MGNDTTVVVDKAEVCKVEYSSTQRPDFMMIYIILPQFGITECFIQYKYSVNTPPPHTIRSG